MTAGPVTTKGTRSRFVLLTASFILVALAWFVHALLVGFDVTISGTAVSSVPFWKVAEVSSIIVTLLVTVVFWGTYVTGSDEHTAVLETSGPKDSILWGAWLLLFCISFIIAGVIALCEGNMIVQVLFLVVGVLTTVKIGHKSMWTTFGSLKRCKTTLANSTDATEQTAKAREVLDKIRARDNISKFLCFSDIPIAFAMVVVFLLVVLWTLVPHENEKEMRAFIAGAVALQLLYSNCVYWIEAWADTPKGRKFLNDLSPALETVRRMLVPEEPPDDKIVDWAKIKLNELFPPDGNGATIGGQT